MAITNFQLTDEEIIVTLIMAGYLRDSKTMQWFIDTDPTTPLECGESISEAYEHYLKTIENK